MRILLRMEYHAAAKIEQWVILEVWAGGTDCAIPEYGGSARCNRDIIIDGNTRHCGDKHYVLVTPVQTIQHMDVFALSSRVRLYDVQYRIANRLGWRDVFTYMTLNGTSERCFIPPDREVGMVSGGFPIGFDTDNVCVVERGPHIVNRIANDGGGVTWKFASKRNGGFPIFFLGLTDEGVTVLYNVGVENRLKLVDVLYGSFGF